MKRKILSLILVFAMTVSLLTVGTRAVEPTYGDTAGHWAESSIERWSAYGIIQGSNGQFDPNGQLTCAQLATILAKLLKLPAAKDAGFTDNTADAWYYDAINRCAAAGILNGNGDGTVTPEAPITRERAMVMLARALGIEPIRKPDLTKYTDAAQVSAYAQGYVAALIEAGIVGGVTADELAPQDNINRASTVTILDRAISTYADKAGATVKADGKGLVLVVAENVKITGAPEGTKIVVADGATGLTVNGKSVSDDQTYIVPKTEPAKPSSGSSGGYSHSHSYVYTDNGDGTHTGRCYANDSTLAPEAHTIVGGKCTVCGAEQTDAVVASVKKSDGTYAYYSTLAEAINAAADGATVTLVKNAEEDITVSGGKALAIDLNGMKLTNKSGDTIVVEIGATLTVTGSGTVDNVTHGKAAIYNNGTVILNGGSYTRSAEASTSIENANGNSYYNILNHGTMTIEENVSVKSSGSFSSLIANGYYSFSDPNPRSGHVSGTNQETPSLTINGGTFSGGINTIKNDDNATLTVNNGSFSNMTQAAIQNNHVATINGGTFDANTYHAIENRHFDGDHNTGSVTVTNGVFTGGLYTTEGAAWNITGGTFSSDPSAYVADGYVAMKNDNGTWTVIAPTAIENGVTIKGIAGYERYAFSTISEAYAEISPKVAALGGLGQETCLAENFNAFYTDNGKITWTIYGKQTLVGKGTKDSQNNDIVVDNYTLTFGRAASYYGDRSLTKIEVKAGNESAALDLSATNGTFALPYNWWGQTVKNIEISFAGIIFDGIKSIPGTWATPEQETPYTFDHCTFNGSVYGYHDYNINLTIQNSTFNAPENTGYAVMLQSTTGINGTVTLDHNTFNGYTRGVNLQRPGTDFIFTNNTITSTVSEPDRAAIQLTDGKSFVVNGNTVRVNAGNAFWFHNAATNNNVTYTISNNDIEAAYIGYSGVTSFNVNDKITSSGNIFNSTDTTRCMKKEATEATATNLTAIH